MRAYVCKAVRKYTAWITTKRSVPRCGLRPCVPSPRSPRSTACACEDGTSWPRNCRANYRAARSSTATRRQGTP
eukprot:3945393-Pleurochrysis_carterae.AAC.1